MLREQPRQNRLAEHIMAQLKTWQIIIKTLHIPPENLKYFVNFEDFNAFLPYSMNKRRRWEVNFLAGISEIQNFNADFDVLFLERTRNGAYEYLQHLDSTLSEQFRIRAVHSLENGKFYKKREINSIFGQDFKHFQQPEDVESQGIVAYNFIKAPENYMTIFKKKCIRKKDNDWPYTVGYLRLRRREELIHDMYSEWNGFAEWDNQVDFNDSETLEGSENVKNQSSKCYNFEDYLIEKPIRKQKGWKLL